MIPHKKSEWFRVTKERPCAICKKEDWCTYSEDGAAGCMRVQSGKTMRNGSWLHVPSSHVELPKYIPKPKPEIQIYVKWDALLEKWKTDNGKIKELAEKLGVEPISLKYLEASYAVEFRAWAFPMRNAKGDIIGFRLRNEQGDKWAVKGSKQGLFYAPKLTCEGLAYLVEGATDTAAAISLGLNVIGRPSCLGCEEMIQETLKAYKIRRLVIIPDNDTPGIQGAEKLQKTLRIPSVLFIPPTKDLREFLKMEGTKEMIESGIKNLVWNTPSNSTTQK